MLVIRMITSLASFVPFRPEVVKRMLEVSHVEPKDVFLDLGFEDGRIIILAVRDFDARKAIGFEIKKGICRKIAEETVHQNLQNKAFLINDDLMKADISEATVIILYLTIYGNERLKPKLFKEARIGTRIVSPDFEIEV